MELYDRRIAFGQLSRMEEEVVMAYFRVLSWHLSGWTKKSYEKPETNFNFCYYVVFYVNLRSE
jgi:hypothetical protein